MNIFVLDQDPIMAAKYLCDKHVVKMAVESAQLMASALRHHGATDEDMPLTKDGKPYAGGYPDHPCTLWAGESMHNFVWLGMHGLSICTEYTKRYDGKEHACREAILRMFEYVMYLPDEGPTPYALAMPDEYKCSDPVRSYRTYYVHGKSWANWQRGIEPAWFKRMRSKLHRSRNGLN